MKKYSKYKGVTKGNGRWQAFTCIDGKRKHIGCYPDEISAARAYNKKVMELFHSKVYTNPLPGDKDYEKRSPLSRHVGPKLGGFHKIRKNKTSRFKGVFWDSGDQIWRVDIKRYGLRYRSRFKKETDAARDYNKVMLEKYGNNVKYLNKIPGRVPAGK